MEHLQGKNIVVCLDGTGNLFNEHRSNVVKLFRVLKRNPKRQIAYYDPGVGTLAGEGITTKWGKKFTKLLGLTTGHGLFRNLAEAYSYLMEHYETNDRIFIFGFSRGAYTARALAGFIHSFGLLEKGYQNLIPYALQLYNGYHEEGDKEEKVPWETIGRFKWTYGRMANGTSPDIQIHFLGLWDTVSTFGWLWDLRLHPYTDNNEDVLAVRHALAIDERRSFFQPQLWGTRFIDKQDVREVWFKGVHSDVGGGYPEEISHLAKVSLKWMLDEACSPKFGLIIDDKKYNQYVMGRDENGNRYKHYVGPDETKNIQPSLKQLWWLVQYLPRYYWVSPEEGKTWQFPKQQREIKKGSFLHYTVVEELTSGKYQPSNLPEEYEIERVASVSRR